MEEQIWNEMFTQEACRGVKPITWIELPAYLSWAGISGRLEE
jgi:hypothetical protein